jgi:flagellar biosynthesis protein
MLEHGQRKAVALLYNRLNDPKVIAKGEGSLADTIVRIAEESGIPIAKDEALAATLSNLELNTEIPETLFRSVAVILAWVYRLQGKTPWDKKDQGEEQGLN